MKRLYKKQAAISGFAQILECGGSTPLAYSTGKTRSNLRRLSHAHPWWGATFSQQHGFTLLEVLVSMVILTMLMTITANIFSLSVDASSNATEMVEVTTRGRAVINFISRKLSHAVAGRKEPETLLPNEYWKFELQNGEYVEFISITDDIVQTNIFYLDADELIYGDGTAEAVLIDNVVDLRFYAHETYENLAEATGDPLNHVSTTNLPYCFDIAVRLIGSGSRKRSANLTGDDLTKFMERNTRWFTGRVYFQLRQGYKKREYDDVDDAYGF